MNFKSPVSIRFNIEGLGENIHAAIMAHGEDVADEIKAGVKAAADNLDIKGIAEEAATDAIEKSVRHTVERFFDYGDGREIIKEMVGEAILNSPE